MAAAEPHAQAREPRSYDAVYKTLHWTVVVLLVVQYLSKWVGKGFAGLSGDALNAIHFSVGPTILLLVLVRLTWRATHPKPPPPRDLRPLLQAFSRTTHWALYALLILQPVLGWVAASARGAHPQLLGFIPLPYLVGRSKDLAESVGDVHGTVAWVLLGVIALHISGALYHALVLRDGVIQRMLPFGRPGPA